MNRRNFLKCLSAIPLVGVPFKLFAKPEAYIGTAHVDGSSESGEVQMYEGTEESFMPVNVQHQRELLRNAKQKSSLWNLRNGSTITWRD